MKKIEKQNVVINFEENLYNLLNVELPNILGISKKGEVNTVIRNTFFTSDKKNSKIVWIVTPGEIYEKKVFIKLLVNVNDNHSHIYSLNSGNLRLTGRKGFNPYQDIWFNGEYKPETKELIGEIMDKNLKESNQIAWKLN